MQQTNIKNGIKKGCAKYAGRIKPCNVDKVCSKQEVNIKVKLLSLFLAEVSASSTTGTNKKHVSEDCILDCTLCILGTSRIYVVSNSCGCRLYIHTFAFKMVFIYLIQHTSRIALDFIDNIIIYNCYWYLPFSCITLYQIELKVTHCMCVGATEWSASGGTLNEIMAVYRTVSSQLVCDVRYYSIVTKIAVP